MPSLRDLVVSRLKEAGVRMIFGVPGGGGNLDLIEAAGHGDLPFVLSATETGGALAALAQAEVTGRPGACLTTLGPGAASAANGVACAFLDRAPVLVFTDSHAEGAASAFEHQRFDHEAFFRPITRWSGRLSADCACRTLDHAFESLLALPPGPVHLDWPADVEPAPTRAADSGPANRSSGPGASVPEARNAGITAGRAGFDELIARSRRPLFIIGLGARQPRDAIAIREFLERRGVPAMVTYKAKGVVPDHHACFAGVFTHALLEQPVVEASDLIVGVGLDPVELLPRPWAHPQPVVYVGRWPVPARHVPFAAQHVTDVPSGISGIDALLQASDWDLDLVRRRVDERRHAIDITAGGMTAQQVVRVVAERLARTTRVTVDAGAHMFPATLLWPVDEPNQMLISNGLSTMGFALPAAVGAALADPARPVVALTGDGGLLMSAAELLTAVREKLRIIVIVFSDRSLSLIEIKQQRRQYRPAGVALGAVNWPALGESVGAASFSAANGPDLVRAVEAAMVCHGPSLIEARIDRSNYSRTLEVVRG